MTKTCRFAFASCFLLILTAFVFFSCVNDKPKEKSKKPRAEKEWIVLFDGSKLDAWRGFKSDSLPGGWMIHDSLFITTGMGGDLGGDVITKQQFEDFRLSLEWKVSKGGNSGIFFNLVEGDNYAVYTSGPEYQLIDDIGFAYPLEEWQKTGANYAMHDADSLKKIRDRQTMEQIMIQRHLAELFRNRKLL